MSKIVWDKVGERFYETGVDRGVLYLPNDAGAYNKGVAWNGLTNVSENPSGAEANAQYADNIKYLNLISAEDFGATIQAFTYPDEFMACDGSLSVVDGVVLTRQPRKLFGFSYRTLVGNDVQGQDFGYKIHLVYNCLAAPSEKSYDTVNDNPEAMSLSWTVSTTPVDVKNHKPTAHLIIDSTKVDADKLAALEDILYGVDGDNAADPRLPLPDEIITLMTPASG